MRVLSKYLCKKELLLGLLLLILGWPLGFYNPFELISKFVRISFSALIFVLSLLNTSIPIWGALIAVFLVLFSKKLCEYIKAKRNNHNGFLQYREDIFNEVGYKWRYKRAKKQYAIVDIRAYCSKCGCHLPLIECPNPECKKVYLKKPMGDHIVPDLIALIRYRLRTVYKIDEYEKIK